MVKIDSYYYLKQHYYLIYINVQSCYFTSSLAIFWFEPGCLERFAADLGRADFYFRSGLQGLGYYKSYSCSAIHIRLVFYRFYKTAARPSRHCFADLSPGFWLR